MNPGESEDFREMRRLIEYRLDELHRDINYFRDWTKAASDERAVIVTKLERVETQLKILGAAVVMVASAFVSYLFKLLSE